MTTRPSARTSNGFSGRGTHAAAVNILGRRIVSHDLTRGAPLDLDGLGAELRFGRTALREALRVLAAKGLIRTLQGQGTFVTDPDTWPLLDPDLLRWCHETDPDQGVLDELSEFRFVVEPAAAGMAAERRSPRDLALFREALDEMDAHAELAEQFAVADLQFHRQVLVASGNRFLLQLQGVMEAGLTARSAVVHSPHLWSTSSAAHELVFSAIQQGSSDLAIAASRSLLELARRHERERVESTQPATTRSNDLSPDGAQRGLSRVRSRRSRSATVRSGPSGGQS